ncbi:MAG TPA: YihY/virulence factor BrkB family protein [Acidimicrobiales bacterium]
MLDRVRKRVPAPVEPVIEVGREMAAEWKADRVSGLAAEVAFFAILAIFPGLLAFAAALGSIEPLIGASAAESVREEVLGFLSGSMSLSEDSTTYEAFARLFEGSSPGLLTLGLLGALVTVSRGFAALIKALDVAYDLEEHRTFARLRGLAVVLAIGSVLVGALVLVMFVVGPLIGAGESVAESVGVGSQFAFLWDWLRWPLATAVLMLWMATIFHIAPNHHTPWRADLPGAVLTTVLVIGVSLGFQLYLTVAGSGNEVFGVLGSAITLLLWLYAQSIAVLVGGELNAILWLRSVEPKAED